MDTQVRTLPAQPYGNRWEVVDVSSPYQSNKPKREGLELCNHEGTYTSIDSGGAANSAGLVGRGDVT